MQMHNTSSFIHTKLMMSSCHTHKILTLSLQTRRTCSLPYTHTSTLNWYPLINTHSSHTSTCALTQTREHQHIHFNTLTWTLVNPLQSKRIRTHTHTHARAHIHTHQHRYTPHIAHTSCSILHTHHTSNTRINTPFNTQPTALIHYSVGLFGLSSFPWTCTHELSSSWNTHTWTHTHTDQVLFLKSFSLHTHQRTHQPDTPGLFGLSSFPETHTHEMFFSLRTHEHTHT